MTGHRRELRDVGAGAATYLVLRPLLPPGGPDDPRRVAFPLPLAKVSRNGQGFLFVNDVPVVGDFDRLLALLPVLPPEGGRIDFPGPLPGDDPDRPDAYLACDLVDRTAPAPTGGRPDGDPGGTDGTERDEP
jgi:hypothetical protein